MCLTVPKQYKTAHSVVHLHFPITVISLYFSQVNPQVRGFLNITGVVLGVLVLLFIFSLLCSNSVSYTHLTLPTNREV